MKLYDYWRSSAAYRVRIALHIKGLAYEQVSIDLRSGGQSAPDYMAVNPQGLVPALDVDGLVLTQSQAIMEWLEESHPAPALLPATPAARAAVRAMAGIITCDIHPLNNSRVQKSLKDDIGATPEQVEAWVARWISTGFDALEDLIAIHGKGFAYGYEPTLADCCLLPQVYNARRFNVDLTPWPLIRAVDEACAKLPAFARAHPHKQPGAEA